MDNKNLKIAMQTLLNMTKQPCSTPDWKERAIQDAGFNLGLKFAIERIAEAIILDKEMYSNEEV
jgi:hypothetical protein